MQLRPALQYRLTYRTCSRTIVKFCTSKLNLTRWRLVRSYSHINETKLIHRCKLKTWSVIRSRFNSSIGWRRKMPIFNPLHVEGNHPWPMWVRGPGSDYGPSVLQPLSHLVDRVTPVQCTVVIGRCNNYMWWLSGFQNEGRARYGGEFSVFVLVFRLGLWKLSVLCGFDALLLNVEGTNGLFWERSAKIWFRSYRISHVNTLRF